MASCMAPVAHYWAMKSAERKKPPLMTGGKWQMLQGLEVCSAGRALALTHRLVLEQWVEECEYC